MGCPVACTASVSVWFRSKEIPRKGTLGFDRARNETKAKKWKMGEGDGKEGNACRQTPRFWKPAFASERSAWLARLVEQYWHVSIKGLFHTERSCMVRDTRINFLWLLFILVGKICPPMQEHFFLTSFKTRWFPTMFCHSGSSSLVCFFWRDVKFSRIVIYRYKFRRMKCTLNWSYIN